MNAKLLYAGTIALALVSSLAYGQQAKPLTRAEVAAEYSRAAAAGTLRNTEYADVERDRDVRSTQTRSDVVADMNASRQANKLVGPMRNRTYNPYGSELNRASTVTRSNVKTEVGAAMRDGSLRRSDYDHVPVSVSRRAARERALAPAGKPVAERSAG
jgi:hypothetical protein